MLIEGGSTTYGNLTGGYQSSPSTGWQTHINPNVGWNTGASQPQPSFYTSTFEQKKIESYADLARFGIIDYLYESYMRSKNTSHDENKYYKKWSSVIENIGFNYSVPLTKDICVFCEIVQSLTNNQALSNIQILPILLRELKNDFDSYMIQNKNLRPTIVRKYFNVVTGKEGFELDNGMLVENSKVINDINNVVENSLKLKLKEVITDILNPKLRMRHKKLNRIILKAI
jgi:hypothetical protein